MSVQADHGPSKLLVDLPSTWLAHLVQHVASGAGGLASAAVFSQTCKTFNSLSESSAVMYRNLHLSKPVTSYLYHHFFLWLAKRENRVAGLTAGLRLGFGDPVPEAEQLELMFSIPGLHLNIRNTVGMTGSDDPFMTKVLRPYGHLIDHLSSFVRIRGDLTLQNFCKAAAPCRSLAFIARFDLGKEMNMVALDHVAGSLVQLHLENIVMIRNVENVSSLALLSQLSSLRLQEVDFGAEEPWIHLVGLTNLKQLSLWVAAPGDCSGLSALTRPSSLALRSYGVDHEDLEVIPYTFSSLQPLSTLQQLEELELHEEACSATSLHGLAELSSLKTLMLEGPMLKSLQGISTGLTSLAIERAPQLVSLAGFEGLTALQQLSLFECGVTSLQPIGQLVGGLKELKVTNCYSVQEDVLELPHIQPTADVSVEDSNVEEVVLAGGVRRAAAGFCLFTAPSNHSQGSGL